MVWVAAVIDGKYGHLVSYASREHPRSNVITRNKFRLARRSGDPDRDYQTDLAFLDHAVRRLGMQPGNIWGFGLALPGKLNAARTSLESSDHLTHWVGRRLRSDIRRMFMCDEVSLGNDVEALAHAEAVYGFGSEPEYRGRDFLAMTWGVGIGGSFVRYLPERGGYVVFPDEPGHVRVGASNHILCGCGLAGCLESYTGLRHLRGYLHKSADQLTRADWLSVLNWMQIGVERYLVQRPAGLVVFSGSVARYQPWLMSALQQRLAESDPHGLRPDVRVSRFCESAGALGALSLLDRIDVPAGLLPAVSTH